MRFYYNIMIFTEEYIKEFDNRLSSRQNIDYITDFEYDMVAKGNFISNLLPEQRQKFSSHSQSIDYLDIEFDCDTFLEVPYKCNDILDAEKDGILTPSFVQSILERVHEFRELPNSHSYTQEYQSNASESSESSDGYVDIGEIRIAQKQYIKSKCDGYLVYLRFNNSMTKPRYTKIIKFMNDYIENFGSKGFPYIDSLYRDVLKVYTTPTQKEELQICLEFSKDSPKKLDIVVDRIEDVAWRIVDLETLFNTTLSPNNIDIYVIQTNNFNKKRKPDLINISQYTYEWGSHYKYMKDLEKELGLKFDLDKYETVDDMKKAKNNKTKVRKNDKKYFYNIDNEDNITLQQEWRKIALSYIKTGLYDIIKDFIDENGKPIKGVSSQAGIAKWLNTLKHIYPPARNRTVYNGSLVRDIGKECHRMRAQDIWKIDGEDVNVTEICENIPPYIHPKDTDYTKLVFPRVDELEDELDRDSIMSYEDFKSIGKMKR